MSDFDIETIRRQVRAMDFVRGTPAEVAMWREDMDESCTNLAIEDMNLSDEDHALFAMMLEEGLSPTTMIDVIHSLYRKPDRAC